MSHSIAELAAALGVEAVGDTSVKVSGVTEPALATESQLALAMDPKYADTIADGSAIAGMLWHGADWQGLGLKAALLPTRPRFSLAALTALMDRGQGYQTGIHPTAVIDPTAQIGADVSIGAFTIVSAGAKIGRASVLAPQVFVGCNSQIGDQSLLREGTKIGADVVVGKRFVTQQNVSVGGDGFSFVTPEKSAVEQTRDSLGADVTAGGQAWARIHSLGGVIIGDDVEIGSGSSVDRGTVRPTQIGNGVKIDSLVQVGHNVVIGNHCLLCAQAGVAGSSRIGNYVVLGGQSGVADNVFVGDGVIAGGGSIILTNVPAGRAVLGYPAIKMESHVDMYKGMRRLSRMVRDISALKKAVFKDDQSG